MQKGAAEYYRGVPVDMTLLPKVKIEVVVAKVPVEEVVSTARKVLYTGHILSLIHILLMGPFHFSTSSHLLYHIFA